MNDFELKAMRVYHGRAVAKARDTSMDYADGVQCLIDRGELLAEVERLREAHQAIVRKYETIMGDPPEWTAFAKDDPRLTFAREAWFGAAQISRNALHE